MMINNNILKGSIYITDNTNVVYNFPLDGMNKIINLDEDEVLPENNNVIGGTCLLPPIEAKIAEVDGDEISYDNYYLDHLTSAYQQQFIGALLSFLYKGGNLLLFLPELGYTTTRDKLVKHLYTLYGIHIGVIGDQNPQVANYFYDVTAIPIWLNLIYGAGVISAYEYLYMFPADANLSTNQIIMEKLINDMKPYSNTIQGKIDYILHYHKLIHIDPNTKQVLRSLN